MRSYTLRNALALGTAFTSLVMPLTTAQSLPNLRIMPLGDSITKGNGEPHNNGYRYRVRTKTLDFGTESENGVDMIGSLRNGDMLDNDHEGHSGEFLDTIRDSIRLSIGARPNVALVHAGTNNMDLEQDLPIADELAEEIIDRLFEGSPEVVVLIAPVIWANDTAMNERSDAFNEKLVGIVERKQEGGAHVLSVPIDIGIEDLWDRKHPNEQGYEKMATAWFEAILDANERGWIKSPTEVDPAELPDMGLGDRESS